jgi:surfeit locus 1 family protein
METPRISRPNSGFKSFRPSIGISLILFSLALLFTTLGFWQSERGAEKKEMEILHQQATEMSLEKALAENNRFSRVSVRGTFDPIRHFLLDNQIWQGRGGVYVFTPFNTVNGEVILVNRGWLPLSLDRKTLPEIPTPENELVLKGILNTLPVPGRILGEDDQLDKNRWPQLLTYMKLDDLSESLQQPLTNWVVQLSQTEPNGFEGREWKPVFLSSRRHHAYAFQWFALTAACIIMWLIFGFRNSLGRKK